jgi:hypothetical protein
LNLASSSWIMMSSSLLHFSTNLWFRNRKKVTWGTVESRSWYTLIWFCISVLQKMWHRFCDNPQHVQILGHIGFCKPTLLHVVLLLSGTSYSFEKNGKLIRRRGFLYCSSAILESVRKLAGSTTWVAAFSLISLLLCFQVTKLLGNEWSKLSLEEKRIYLERAEVEKKRYREELKAYRQSDAYQSYLNKKRTKSKSWKEVHWVLVCYCISD